MQYNKEAANESKEHLHVRGDCHFSGYSFNGCNFSGSNFS